MRGSTGHLSELQSLEEEGREDLHLANLDDRPQPLAWRSVNRRLLLPLFLFTVAVLAGVQAQRTDGSAAAYEPTVGRLSAVLSVRRVPEFLQAPTAVRNLRADLHGAVAGLPEGTCVEVAEHGHQLYTLEAGRGLVPASAQKLLTGLAALRHLGPAKVLSTRVVAEVPVVDLLTDPVPDIADRLRT